MYIYIYIYIDLFIYVLLLMGERRRPGSGFRRVAKMFRAAERTTRALAPALPPALSPLHTVI